MQRYFVAREQLEPGLVRLTGDDAHHLVKVMRAGPGDEFICSDGCSREVLAKISSIDRGLVEAEIVRELPMDSEAAVEVWIAQSLPKGDKLETVIQKCTELGADRFIPFISERTIVSYDEKKESKRLARWDKIAKEAAEQAHRNRIPGIDSPLSWKQLLKLVPEADLGLICYEQESGLSLRPQLAELFRRGEQGQASHGGRGPRPRVLVLVGPEGGFAAKEVQEAVDAGCASVSLGRRILRTETAAMAALTCIMYESGEMGG
ncbi:MAG: rRNA ((1498)-N(3))-methyltransferase [Paenibacillaceae bacterium]|jgi:16S rRNA (uracil1498-N3)-methyltransferase|nr:rRNA ((1498)-N(3))-methyltransferase [Paenibacillaceae bacterium]